MRSQYQTSAMLKSYVTYVKRRINQSIDLSNSFYFYVVKNWLKASLVLHTRELKEDNGKTKTKCWAVRSP